MEQQLTTNNYFNKDTWDNMKGMALTFIASKALPSGLDNQAKVVMVLQAGYEKGMKPVESLNSFYIVNGKINMYGASVIGMLKKAGYKIKWNEVTDENVSVTITGTDGDSHTEAYSFKEATKAGNTGKDIWKKYTKNMLRYKALGNAIRFFCPEVLEGMYIKEEMDDHPETNRPVGSSTTTDVSITETVDRINAVTTKEQYEAMTNTILPPIINMFNDDEKMEIASAVMEAQKRIDGNNVTPVEHVVEATDVPEKIVSMFD